MTTDATIDQDDFVSSLFGRNMALNCIQVILPSFLKFEDDYEELNDAEAEYEDFLSFITNFQAKSKG